ncbi:hypothetical protein EU537_08055 [Candidatus Thorarchaeota archaeon]|nr:MAG: hypothetical protein EU537_08055 [Candidatus Thorarchaeota archaeon]
MKSNKLGPILIFFGLIGGGILWAILVSLRFWYLVNNVPGKDIGEAIWVFDAEFTLLAAVPGFLLTLYGLYITAVDENQSVSKSL